MISFIFREMTQKMDIVLLLLVQDWLKSITVLDSMDIIHALDETKVQPVLATSLSCISSSSLNSGSRKSINSVIGGKGF